MPFRLLIILILFCIFFLEMDIYHISKRVAKLEKRVTALELKI